MSPRPRSPQRASVITLLVIEVGLFPVGVLLVSFGFFGQMRSGGLVLLLIVPALVSIPAALFMAWQYQALCKHRVAKPYRSSPWASLLLTTLLFTIVLYILAGTYFCGGCLYLLSQFSL